MKKKIGLTVLAVAAMASGFANAASQVGLGHTVSQLIETHKITPTKVLSLSSGAQAGNGYDVAEVFTPTGSFISSGQGQWIEKGNDGARFYFQEIGRDASSVYLRDEGRGVNLRLNIQTRKIMYSDDAGQSFELYQITDARSSQSNNGQNSGGGQIGEAASAVNVQYTCSGGIPMSVVYENIGNDSWATWYHDGAQGSRLPSVISGSGVKYSDGRYTVWQSKNTVYINLDGIEDTCVED